VKTAGQVQLYQRTAAWIKPRINFAFPRAVRRAFEFVPGLRAALRTATYWAMDSRAIALAKRPQLMRVAEWMYKANMRRYIKDPQLRAKLTPHYRAGCKRILISDNFYQAVADPKTEVITDGIARVSSNGIVTVDGTERPVDAIVLATGFHVTDWFTFLDIKGANGEDVGDRWTREGVMAHRGITVADVPNLFLLLGPNTGLGHNSVVFMIESQIHYVASAIAVADKMGARALPNPRRSGSVQRGTAERPVDNGLEHRRLPELVPRRTRGQPLAVVRLGLGVLAGDAQFQAVGVHVQRSRVRHANTRCRGSDRCRTPGVVSE